MGDANRATGWLAGAVLALAALVLLAVPPSPAASATPALADQGLHLVMVEEVGCRFCLAWERDVGAVYGKSPEAAVAPLVKVRRGSALPATWKPVVYTPTFILAEGEREIGRITGYPGESFFWEELGELLKLAGQTLPGVSAQRSEALPRAGPALRLSSPPPG